VSQAYTGPCANCPSLAEVLLSLDIPLRKLARADIDAIPGGTRFPIERIHDQSGTLWFAFQILHTLGVAISYYDLAPDELADSDLMGQEQQIWQQPAPLSNFKR